MAKYKLNPSGTHTAECDILNETDNSYVVRFQNDSVKLVNKNRIFLLNKMDEGVLDYAKKAASGVSKFGTKLVNKAKEFFNMVVNVFKKGGFVFFMGNGDDVLTASHPINAMVAAENNKSINVYPSSTMREMCSEFGMIPRAIENFDYEGEYEGAMQYTDNVQESARKKSFGTILESIMNEDENKDKKENDFVKGKPINPRPPVFQGTKTPMFYDFTAPQIVNMIMKEYDKRLNGSYKGFPVFIWGAPGVGKTEIVNGLVELVKEKYGKRPGMIAINARTISSESFSFPASVMKGLSDEEIALMSKIAAKKSGASYEDVVKKFKDESMKTAVISDLPKDWMPVYNPKDPRGEEFIEMSRRIANGGKINPETGELEDGPGGFIFIDEYARMSDDAVASLMQLPVSRYFSTESQTLGDRWVIVAAANRKTDLGARNSRDFVNQDAAMNTRWKSVNFVPDFNEWETWANKDRKNGQKNVHPKIVEYVKRSIAEGKTHGEEFGDFYNMSDIGGTSTESGMPNTAEPKACPRSWEAASEELYGLIDDYGEITQIPTKELQMMIAINVGVPVARRFVEYIQQFEFTTEDANAVWNSARSLNDADLKKFLNMGNFESFMTDHVFPELEANIPNSLTQQGISPENILNVVNWIEKMAPKKSGGNDRLDVGTMRKIYKQFGSDIAGVELIDYDSDDQVEDLYAEPRNRVLSILMNNDATA